MLVYLISTYDEYGSEGMRGTSSTDDLPRLIRDYFNSIAASWPAPDREQHISELLEALPQVILDAKASPGEPQDLTDDWGGPQLHVIDVP